MNRTIHKHWIFLSFILVLCFILNLSFGSVAIPFREILSIIFGKEGVDPVWKNIIWEFRMTKALTCLLAGSALSLAGLQMQTLFRNALAGPDVLGLSSGASLAVSLIFMGQTMGVTLFTNPSPWTVVVAASAGCSGVFIIVLIIARRLRDNTSLLIVGLMIGATVASVVSVLQFLSNASDQQAFLIWTFGSLGGLNWLELKILCLVAILGFSTSIWMMKPLNAWALGDFYARSIGINISSSRVVIIFSACVLTGSVTAFCGPIAFVGLAVPHLTKLLFRTHNHRVLIPGVILMGALLMLFCDILTQLPGTSYILPLNAITAIIGAPVVISIILRAKRVAV